MRHRQAQFERLTDTMRDVAEICGIDTAQNLVYYFKGCRLYIPKKLAKNSQLMLLGEKCAQNLCRAFGGGEIEVPRNIYSAEGLAATALEMSGRNMRQNDIALALDISARNVRLILQGGAGSKSRARRQKTPQSGQMDIEDYLRAGK